MHNPSSPLLEGLNPPQVEAVTTPLGPVLVLAGPGSGKTRVLTHRIAYLIDEYNISPYRVLAVTFTNKAAQEMQVRIDRLLGGRIDGLRIGTFHASAARILRIEAEYTPAALTRDFVIFDTSDQRAAIKAVMNALNIDPKRYRPSSLLSRISQAKNELIGPAAYRANSYLEEVAGRVYAAYQALLEENNAMDFDDLLMRTVTLFQEHPHVLQKYREKYRAVLVDEFQDTNTAQYVLVKQLTLAPEHRNLFVVGDEDQSIYLFRGADYRNVRRFEKDFPDHTKILLEQNYRSTQVILDAANAVIVYNQDRTPKQLFTARQGGAKIILKETYDENDEANYVVRSIRQICVPNGRYEPREVAVMYRTNAQSRALEEAFILAGLPYRLVGATRFYSRREIKDLIAYLRVVYNPGDRVSLMRVINTPTRRIGAKTVQALAALAAARGESMGAALLALADAGDTVGNALSRTARKALSAFATLYAEWHALLEKGASPPELLDAIIEQIGYKKYINDGSSEGQDRWENVQELRGVVGGYADLPLGVLLEEVALVSDTDTREEDDNKPSLMTLHAAKGLEFSVVFLVGLEERILPHALSMDDPDAMAEERRLMYVGLTRAKDRLYLSYTFRRTRWGDTEENEPSRFLRNIPGELLATGAPRSVTGARQRESYRQKTTWNRTPAYPTKPASPTPPPTSEAMFHTGQRVRHAKFGAGIVVASKITRGDEMVTVVFDDKKVGIKNLMVSFAKLEQMDA